MTTMDEFGEGKSSGNALVPVEGQRAIAVIDGKPYTQADRARDQKIARRFYRVAAAVFIGGFILGFPVALGAAIVLANSGGLLLGLPFIGVGIFAQESLEASARKANNRWLTADQQAAAKKAEEEEQRQKHRATRLRTLAVARLDDEIARDAIHRDMDLEIADPEADGAIVLLHIAEIREIRKADATSSWQVMATLHERAVREGGVVAPGKEIAHVGRIDRALDRAPQAPLDLPGLPLARGAQTSLLPLLPAAAPPAASPLRPEKPATADNGTARLPSPIQPAITVPGARVASR